MPSSQSILWLLSSKIKILHLAKWYPNANDEQNGIFIQQLIQNNSNFANQAVIYWGPGEEFHSSSALEQGIHAFRYYFPSGKRIQNASRKWASIRKAIKETWNDEKPDLIHLHVADTDQLMLLEYAKSQRIPIVLSEHWSGYVDGRFEEKNPIAKSLIKHLVKGADYCTAVSEYLASGIRNVAGRKTVDVIPNAVNVISRKRTHSQHHTHFAMLCDLDDKVKNISGVISAFKNYYEENPASTLSIIGGGKDEEKLIRLVENLKLTEVVSFKGRHNHSESLDYLNESDTVIINSPRETFSVVSLEAIALGKKLICTRCGGPEGFLNDDLVRWTQPNDPSDLLNAMKESAEMPYPSDIQVIQQIEPFLPEVVASRWQEYYKGVLKSNR